MRGLRQASHRNITISHSFDLEHLATFRCLVKCLADRLEKRKDLTRFPDGTPGSKARNVCEHDRRIVEQIGDWFGL
jgi:hypothetical protein